ncbi:MAG TPA: flagellar hook-length control protein FliK, partial [Telluria sp.]|nr:flagellar hook-length control protein FliK [Telluria sp.]
SAVAKADAATEEEATDTAQAVADEPSNPVADMLALVASFNQSMRKAAPAEAASTDVRTASADAGQLAALQAAGKRFTADVADTGKAAAQVEQPDGAEPRTTLADALGTVQPKAAPDSAEARSFAPALETATKRAATAGADAALLRDAALTIEEVKAPAPQAQFVVQAQAANAALEAARGANPAGEHIPARVGTPGWDNQVGQKIVWMVAGGDQSAELTLNPPDLGPMQVVLNVSGDQASVTFSANQLEVRQALENALPRLREMMSESGIALGNATVNSGSDQRQAQDGQAGSGNGGGARFAGNGDTGSTEAARPAARTTVLGDRGMVDTFA